MDVLHCPFSIWDEGWAAVGYTYIAFPSDLGNVWAARPCAGLSWPNREQWIFPYLACSKDREPAENSCTPQFLPCPMTACVGRFKGSLVRLTCAAVMPLCHPPAWLFQGTGRFFLCMALLCSHMPQDMSQLSLTNIVRLINIALLVIMLKIFRFSLLITNTLFEIMTEVYCIFILTRESCDNELFVPDIQRGQALINLLLSSRIFVDCSLEDSELSLQWLMKTKVSPLCTQAFGGAQNQDL